MIANKYLYLNRSYNEYIITNGDKSILETYIVSSIDATACIVGHIQRGGSPVAKDIILATKMGVAAIQKLMKGKSNMMIAEQNNIICEISLENAVKHTKKVSQGLINAQENILALTAQNQC